MVCNIVPVKCFTILEVFLATSPPDTHNWSLESVVVNDNGGVFYSKEHGVTVTVPQGAIKSGINAKLKFGAIMFAPVKFSKNTRPVSAVFWLCMNVTLQKFVQIQIPHCVHTESKTQASYLRFAKAVHLQGDGSMMEIIDGGEFDVGKSFGSIKVDHFCYYCIVHQNFQYQLTYVYKAILFYNKQLDGGVWYFDICIISTLPTCEEVSIFCYLKVCMYVYRFSIKHCYMPKDTLYISVKYVRMYSLLTV